MARLGEIAKVLGAEITGDAGFEELVDDDAVVDRQGVRLGRLRELGVRGRRNQSPHDGRPE